MMRWTDSREIAIALMDAHPDVNPRTLNFVELAKWIQALPDFNDDPHHCGEKVLEAVQMAWMDEAD